jgi:hypothetical protein
LKPASAAAPWGQKCDPGNDDATPPAVTIVGPSPTSMGTRRRDNCKVIGSGQAIGAANPLGGATPSAAVPLIEPWQ